jgi:hypothetical protein
VWKAAIVLPPPSSRPWQRRNERVVTVGGLPVALGRVLD